MFVRSAVLLVLMSASVSFAEPYWYDVGSSARSNSSYRLRVLSGFLREGEKLVFVAIHEEKPDGTGEGWEEFVDCARWGSAVKLPGDQLSKLEKRLTFAGPGTIGDSIIRKACAHAEVDPRHPTRLVSLDELNLERAKRNASHNLKQKDEQSDGGDLGLSPNSL